MCDEIHVQPVESLRLPKGWRSSVRNAVLNAIGIVRIAMLAGREALISKRDAIEARIHHVKSKVVMLREELRINGDRMPKVPRQRRLQSTTVERMGEKVAKAFAELRAGQLDAGR